MKTTAHLHIGVRPRCATALLLALLVLSPFAVAEDEPLEQLWLVRPHDDSYNGSPAFTAKLVWVANTKGDLFGLDPVTGKTKVTAKVPGRTYGGLTATKDAVYVCGQAIRKIDAKTGKVVWTHDFGAPCSREPAVDGDHVFTVSNRGHLALLSAKTGKAIWRRQLPMNPEQLSLGGDTAFVSASGQNPGLHILDRKTGATRWTAPFAGRLGGLACSGFSIGRGVVYYGDAALNLADGLPVWRVSHPARFWVAGPHAVVAVFGGREIAGLDPETGADLWSWEAPGVRDTGRIPVRKSPAVVDGTVVVAVEEGHITLLSERTGKVIATKRFHLKTRDDLGHFHETPVIRDGRLIVTTSHNKVLALRFDDKIAAWTMQHGGPGQWGQSFEPDIVKLLKADPPADLSGLDAEKGKDELAEALAVEERNARVVALLHVIREFDEKTLAGYRARKQAVTLIESIELSLSLRNLPDVPVGVTSVPSDKILAKLLEAEPVDPDTIDGLFDLDDVDIAEGLCSPYHGLRAWACLQLGKVEQETARPILIDRAKNDPDALVRAAATEKLRGDQSKEARELIRTALTEGSPDVRRAAVAAARSVLGDAEGKKLLAQVASNDKDWLVKALAKEKAKD